jgi:ParB-like chromosome segregation protein Spo0J
MNLQKLEVHELAADFPPCTDDEAKALANDIKKNGLLEPITLFEEKILDGRNRYNACRVAGYSLGPNDVVEFEEQYPDDDPLLFVYSKNILRRHMTIGQRGQLGDLLYERLREAEKRKKTRRSDVATVDCEAVSQKSKISDGLRPDKELKAKAAAAAGTSVGAIETARTLKKEAPDLAAEVQAGEKPLHTAAKEQKERKKAKRQQRKIDGQVLDMALKRVKEVCGKAFCGAITDDGADSIPALKTPVGLVEFAACTDEEMLWMVNPLCTGMTLVEVRRFRERRFDPKGEPLMDQSWTAQEFLALMGPRKKLTKVFTAPAGTYAWTMELRPSQEELKAEEARKR